MYVRREAVLSSQIEGTQSTLEDLLAVELEPRPAWRDLPQDVDEVVRYVHAMNYGLTRLSDLPLSDSSPRFTANCSPVSADLIAFPESSDDRRTGSDLRTQPWQRRRSFRHPSTR